MKVVVLGGTGVFGERIARLLIKDEHKIVIAGRRRQALEDLGGEIGADILVLDRSGDLGRLWAIEPDMVVDAAGPFHAYGDDPYRLAREAISARVNYLDLSDDADFCQGIAELDQQAKDAGVFVLSGVSSVPALSSSVVSDLAGDLAIDTIQTAILPGNRAPRGQSVVDSILYQAGTPYTEVVDGEPRDIRSWSDPHWFDLNKSLRRLGFAIRVPDQELFPKAFGARTVRFHASLDLGLTNWGMAGFSWLRSKLGFGVPAWFSRLMRRAAMWLQPFGSNSGGMAVDVIVKSVNGWERRSWRLVATDGEGPFIPGVPTRVVARNPDAILPGARAAIAEFNLKEAEAAMADLAVKTDLSTAVLIPLFPQVLGADMDRLPKSIQDSHEIYSTHRLKGRGSVERGSGLLERIIAFLVGFPKATDDIEVEVIKSRLGEKERWERRFGENNFQSTLRIQSQQMTEQFGPLRFGFDFNVNDEKLHYPVVWGGCFGIPMPKWSLPKSVSCEHDEKGIFHFDVGLYAPLTKGLIVRYRGWLKPTTVR